MTLFDIDLIETPENVQLERRLAGIGSRFIAGLLDSLLLLAAALVVQLLVLVLGAGWSLLTPVNAGPVAMAVGIVLLFVLFWGYHTFFELSWNGQTLGKRAIRIRVVKVEGQPIRFTDVAIRNLLRPVDFIPLAYVLGGTVMFFTRRCQRLGDLAAGTVVASEAPINYAARTDRTAPALEPEPVSPEALQRSPLEPREYQLLESYRRRRTELTLQARRELLPKLLGPVLRRLNVELPDRRLETMEAWVDDLLAGDAGASPPVQLQERT